MKKRTRWLAMAMTILMLVTVLPILHGGARAAALWDAADTERFLDTWMQAQMEEHHIANATVAIVVDGQVLVTKGYGYAERTAQIPVDAQTSLFRIGSTSKLFTWVSVMQLVEQGLLDLDTDVNAYLDFTVPARLAYAASDSQSAPITLRHLMTHTAGFEDYSSKIFTLDPARFPTLASYVKEQMPERVFPAGEVIAYSNYGVALAGYIVQRVADMPFAEYVEQHILQPLGMDHSTMRQPLPEALLANMVTAYRDVDGVFRSGRFEYVPAPAGGMSASASDMAKFMLLFLQGEGDNREDSVSRVLPEQTLAKMLSPLFRQHPLLKGMGYGFIEGGFNGRSVYFHPGSTMLFNSGLYLVPDEGVGLFISYSGGNYLFGQSVFQAFMDHYFPQIEKPEYSPLSGMQERSAHLTGEYQQNRRSFTTEDKFLSLVNGVIRIAVDDQGYLLVTHLGVTDRFVEIDDGVYYNLREGHSQDFGGDFRTLVFGSDPYGRTMLMADGPLTYSKAPWYASSTFTFLLLGCAVLFILGSMGYRCLWAVIVRRRQGLTDTPVGARIAKGLLVLYGLLTIVLLLELLYAGRIDPVYQLPINAYTAAPVWEAWTKPIPYMMNGMVMLMLVCTGIVWKQRYWTMAGRIHYTLYTVSTLAMGWILIYWQVM